MITETNGRNLLLSELKRINDLCEKNKNDYQSRLKLSEIYAKLGDMEGVITSCKEAINIEAGIPDAHYNLGLALHRLGRLDEAKKSYIKTLQLDQLHLYSLLNMGTIFKLQKNYSRAYTYYSKALKMQPTLAEALLDCGTCCIEMKQYTEAYVHILKYINYHGGHDDAYCKLGICMIHLNKNEQAQIYFDKSLSINPDHAESYYYKDILASNCNTEPSKNLMPYEKSNPTHINNVSESIKRAIKYFSKPPPIKLDYPYLYFYLQKKFGIKSLFTPETINNLIHEYNKKKDSKNNFILFCRLIDPSQNLPDKLLKKITALPIDGLTLQALYCDRWPSFNYQNFISTIKTDILKGKYYLTHAMIALMWAKENNHVTDDDLESLKQRAAIKCLNHLQMTKEYDDLTIEVIAMLQYTGHHSLIKHDWIIGILSSQMEDGGWLWDKHSEKTNTHTSVLALWTLLEYQNPGKQVNWIEQHKA